MNERGSSRTTYFLRSKRLGFRVWRLDDIFLAQKLWGNERVTRFIDARGKLTPDQVRERLKKEIETEKSHGMQYWPIFLLENDRHVGCCGLRPYDWTQRIYEIGAHIIPDYWRKGFAAEALRTVMAYAFDELNARSLFAGHNPQNDASRSLLKKIGFRYTHDEYYPPTGLNHPSYSLTQAEYARLKGISRV